MTHLLSALRLLGEAALGLLITVVGLVGVGVALGVVHVGFCAVVGCR